MVPIAHISTVMNAVFGLLLAAFVISLTTGLSEALAGNSSSASAQDQLINLNNTISSVCGGGVNDRYTFDYTPPEEGDEIIFPDDDKAAVEDSSGNRKAEIDLPCEVNDNEDNYITFEGLWHANKENGEVVFELP